MCHLLKTPRLLGFLNQEICGAFSNFGEIGATSTVELPYHTALIKGGLRIGPANLSGWPQYSPGEEVDEVYIPEGVRVQSRSYLFSVNNSPRPWLLFIYGRRAGTQSTSKIRTIFDPSGRFTQI